MKVIVTRAAGDNPSPDVLINNLCVTEAIAIEKGKTYLYDVGFDKLMYGLQIKLPQNFICGDVIEFYDPDYGSIIRGRVIGWGNNCTVDEDGAVEYSQQVNIETEIVVD
jgi:hypothetical protein